MTQHPSDDEFRLGLWQLVEGGAELLRRQGLESSQQAPQQMQMKTVDAAMAEGTIAAVKALTVAVGPLCHPRQTPTLEQGEQALQALRAYEQALHHTLSAFCTRLEALLGKQELREEGETQQP